MGVTSQKITGGQVQ